MAKKRKSPRSCRFFGYFPIFAVNISIQSRLAQLNRASAKNSEKRELDLNSSNPSPSSYFFIQFSLFFVFCETEPDLSSWQKRENLLEAVASS
ncbi:hypothetical protein L0N11_02410, partial [Streptococcus gordonii]|nr:hypothetical protein [Streptococcus gordonii]